MNTPEEVASQIDEEFPVEARMASKVSSIITRVLEPLGLAEDQIFRSKVARELIKKRIKRNNSEAS